MRSWCQKRRMSQLKNSRNGSRMPAMCVDYSRFSVFYHFHLSN
uniref:Uncharacterized protein n=1 Tax=Parascaris equorum TaxID=6256 RepID=A0A914RIN0_PAREQ